MPRLSPDQRRREIAEAAYQVFGERGYRDAGIAEVAEKLSIGHGTVYRYFSDKEQVFATVIDLALEKVATLIAAESPDASESLDDYRAQLERIGDRLFALFIEDPHIANILFARTPDLGQALSARLEEALELFTSYTRLYLVNGKKKRYLRADLDVDITSRAINAILFEGVRQVWRAEESDRAKREWVRAVTRLLLFGMQA